jgi:hypothetical protein
MAGPHSVRSVAMDTGAPHNEGKNRGEQQWQDQVE